MASQTAMFAMIYLTQKFAKDSTILTGVIGALAGAVMGLAVAWNLGWTAANPLTTWKFGAAVVTGMIAMAGFNLLMKGMMEVPEMKEPAFEAFDLGGTKDLGGRMMNPRRNYGTGGAVEGSGHFPVMVEAGETIIPKTQNMLGGGGGGVTIVVEGNVYDSENFAETVANILPKALRNADDRGGWVV